MSSMGSSPKSFEETPSSCFNEDERNFSNFALSSFAFVKLPLIQKDKLTGSWPNYAYQVNTYQQLSQTPAFYIMVLNHLVAI